mgnify:CR=1 FL=1
MSSCVENHVFHIIEVSRAYFPPVSMEKDQKSSFPSDDNDLSASEPPDEAAPDPLLPDLIPEFLSEVYQ